MMKKFFSLQLMLALVLSVSAQQHKTQVDFGYSFAEPYRLTICMPSSSNKTILESYSDHFMVRWTYLSCKDDKEPGVLIQHGLPWKVNFRAQVDTTYMKGRHWSRIDDWIPAFDYEWFTDNVSVKAKIVASDKGDVLIFTATNNDNAPHKINIDASVWNNVVNMKWLDRDYPYSVITPVATERGDRLVLLDPEPAKAMPNGLSHINIVFNLAPNASDSHMLVRPYNAFKVDLQQMFATDWKAEAEKGISTWKELIGKAPVLILPDVKINNAFKACLSDIFVMREEQGDGKMGGLDGTDLYRSSNSFEPNFQAMSLCRLGYYKEAKENIMFSLQFQDKDGDWNDPEQWTRLMWASSGYKSYYIKQYYLQTHDTTFLREQFPRMLASSRWSWKQRERTKRQNKPDSPEWGLMPRGMGDCGLKDGDDLIGVFYPHNFLHCMGLEVNAWAAKELGRNDVYKELYDNYKDLYDCINKSLKVGVIHEADGTEWIPGTPNKTSGSRWGVAEAVYPANIIDKNSPLAIGTMKRLQNDISEGGLPLNLGWMKGGLWVAIALDAMAYVDILQGNADQAASYLYAVINHGTPLYSWCEERLPEKGATVTSGDRQHAWTPICITRFVRDMLVMEDEDDNSLWLTRAVPRWWYSVGEKIGVKEMTTAFGKVSYNIERTKADKLRFSISLKDYDKTHPIKLQLRLPEKTKGGISTSAVKGAKVKVEKDCLTIVPKSDLITGTVNL